MVSRGLNTALSPVVIVRNHYLFPLLLDHAAAQHRFRCQLADPLYCAVSALSVRDLGNIVFVGGAESESDQTIVGGVGRITDDGRVKEGER